MSARGRLIAVLGFLLAGGIGVISATQTWLTVTRLDGSEPILVAGSDAVPLLAPLSLAALALGAALSITGLVLRYIFAALAAGAAVVLGVATAPLVAAPPLSVVAGVVAEKTGLAGDAAMHEIVAAITPTAWPVIAMCCWVLMLAAAVFTAVTARGWKSGGRRYRTDDAHHDAHQRPLDAVDSWDDLSRGTDPTR
ncbi:Trp biosynthesis-associated membrane protein [Microbacterium sp. NPDC057659]|uniref:Trp biosynthesis-associated membrane protein n=1 Tax=Microbacterium sp. NPDC057659 TaxID=3346198 RepID=UPI00366AB273